MKNRISLFIIFILIFSLLCGTTLSFADTKEKEYLDDKIYHHLDMGVYVAIKDSKGWHNNASYGGYANITTKLTFPNPVEIIGVHKYSEDMADSFTFNDAVGDTWNIKVTENTPKKTFQHYLADFEDKTTKEVSSISATAVDKDVTLSYRCKLESPEKQDVAAQYKSCNGDKTLIDAKRKVAYRGWGNRDGLVAQASYDANAKTILDGLDSIFSGKAPA
jgi:hypothetical protein